MPDNHQEHVILPIGTIMKSTKAGTTIKLIPPHPSTGKLQPQATILIRNSGSSTHAKATVRVVEIQGNLALFDIMETEPEWPEGADPLEVGQPVYLALPGTFEPDPEPQGTVEEIQAFLDETHQQGCCPAMDRQEVQEEIQDPPRRTNHRWDGGMWKQRVPTQEPRVETREAELAMVIPSHGVLANHRRTPPQIGSVTLALTPEPSGGDAPPPDLI